MAVTGFITGVISGGWTGTISYRFFDYPEYDPLCSTVAKLSGAVFGGAAALFAYYALSPDKVEKCVGFSGLTLLGILEVTIYYYGVTVDQKFFESGFVILNSVLSGILMGSTARKAVEFRERRA